MANLNKKRTNGKTPQQIRDTEKLAWIGVAGMIVLLIILTLL